METMRYKLSDKVRIKSIDWYNENKDELGNVGYFSSRMKQFCGQIAIINKVVPPFYHMENVDIFLWTDEMIEGLVDEENNHLTETVVDYVKESNDRYRIVIDPRFDIEVDEGEYYAVRRKKEYPKTYEECAKIMNCPIAGPSGWLFNFDVNIKDPYYRKIDILMGKFTRLLICRDAYWKIAGDEIGLGKPWEPDWLDDDVTKYVISHDGRTFGTRGGLNYINYILAFPTTEMRDAFYENFKEEIEICKELL